MIHAPTSMSEGARLASENKCVLVISNSSLTVSEIDKILTPQGFDIVVASGGKQALSLFAINRIDYVLVDLDAIDIPGDELVYSLRVRGSDNFIPIVVIAPAANEQILSDCLSAGCDDFLLKPFSAITLKTRLASLDQIHDLKNLYRSSINEQLVAKQILAFALSERNVEFEEVKLLSKSKEVFSGDLFLTAKHPDGGIHVLLADFTGHGLSAAIGALPVADIFSVMTGKGFEIEDILENLNNKLHTLLPVSMFMACIMLKVESDLKHVKIWNGGMPDVYLRDNLTGEASQKVHSTHIALGITDSIKEHYVPEIIETHPNDQLIIYSDGLIEAENINGDMFGYEHIEQCIEKYRSEKSIFQFLVDGFNRYCNGNNPDDDVTLACIPCSCDLTEINDSESSSESRSVNSNEDGWHWYMELSGSSLQNIDPVPIAIGEAYKIFGQAVSEARLTSVLKALYDNAMLHGLSGLTKKNSNIDNGDSYLRIGLKKIEYEAESALLVSIEDSGDGFNYTELLHRLKSDHDDIEVSNDGIPLVYEISDALHYHGRGNRVEAILNVRL